jgi:hypothetical protein
VWIGEMRENTLRIMVMQRYFFPMIANGLAGLVGCDP